MKSILKFLFNVQRKGCLFMFDQIDSLAISSIRTLSIDAIEKANSGHPGMPMGVSSNGLYIMESLYEP